MPTPTYFVVALRDHPRPGEPHEAVLWEGDDPAEADRAFDAQRARYQAGTLSFTGVLALFGDDPAPLRHARCLEV